MYHGTMGNTNKWDTFNSPRERNMKQTRRLQIRQRIFKMDDLKRIANVFDNQARLAKKSDHHHTVKYTLYFADSTSFESDMPALLDNTILQIKRPVKVEFYFCNYNLERSMSFSITHGDSEYGNQFGIAANEQAWLNDNFTKIETFVNGAKPQSFWFVRHPIILANLIALGVGSLLVLFFDIFLNYLLDYLEIPRPNSDLPVIKNIRAFIAANQIWFYLAGWFWRWFLGWLGCAHSIAYWLLSAWPNIDLDFGADHLKIEKKRRLKIITVITLIVVPTLLSIVQDIIGMGK